MPMATVPAPKPEDFRSGGRLDVEALSIYIWDVLFASLRNESEPIFPTHVDADCSYPLFVTFTEYDYPSQENGNLRGCIGCLEEIKMSETKDYVRKAAFQDSRFAAIRERDTTALGAQMSILHTFEKVDKVLDWEFGTHGMVIEFAVGNRGYTATYLPEVVDDSFREHGKEYCITELMNKAGYRPNGIHDPKIKDLKLTRYQSARYNCRYDEYRKYVDGGRPIVVRKASPDSGSTDSTTALQSSTTRSN